MPKIVSVFMIILIITVVTGCTTAHSRYQETRIENLERRVSKIEFDFDDSSSSDMDYSKYIQQARMAK